MARKVVKTGRKVPLDTSGEHQFKAFLTGSRVYGTPRVDSDVDLVIFMDRKDFEILQPLMPDGAVDYEDGTSLRIGNINLLVCWDNIRYQTWVMGTEMLKEKAPVTRETAKALFVALREKAGLQG